MLKAGSVVGGDAHASAIYFNPALISQEEGPSLTLSASLISIQFFKAENLVGDGIEVEYDISFTLEYYHQIDQYELFDSDYQATNLPEGWEDDMDVIKPMSYSY